MPVSCFLCSVCCIISHLSYSETCLVSLVHLQSRVGICVLHTMLNGQPSKCFRSDSEDSCSQMGRIVGHQGRLHCKDHVQPHLHQPRRSSGPFHKNRTAPHFMKINLVDKSGKIWDHVPPEKYLIEEQWDLTQKNWHHILTLTYNRSMLERV
jgi:hypothetical protein